MYLNSPTTNETRISRLQILLRKIVHLKREYLDAKLQKRFRPWAQNDLLGILEQKGLDVGIPFHLIKEVGAGHIPRQAGV